MVGQVNTVSSLLDGLGRFMLVLVTLIAVLVVVPALALGLIGLLQVTTDPSTSSLLCWAQDCRTQGAMNLVASIVIIASVTASILVRRSGPGSPVAGVIAGGIITGPSLGLFLVSKPDVNLAAAGVFAVTIGLALAVGSGLRLIARHAPSGSDAPLDLGRPGQADGSIGMADKVATNGEGPASRRAGARPTRMARSSPRHSHLLVGLGVLTLVISGCGTFDAASDTVEVACHVGTGAARFPTSYLDGPESEREVFIATDTGRTLQAFFTAGPGIGEDEHFTPAEGFSVVSDSLVLAYRDGLPFAIFTLDGDHVEGWGSCQPNLVRGDSAAERWGPVKPIDSDAVTLPIRVQGSGCATGGGVDITTEIASIDVVEDDDSVRITAWTRERHGFLEDLLHDTCASIGVAIDADAELAAPLGDRVLNECRHHPRDRGHDEDAMSPIDVVDPSNREPSSFDDQASMLRARSPRTTDFACLLGGREHAHRRGRDLCHP